jgi:CBS domain containing-hemolysin-like protein
MVESITYIGIALLLVVANGFFVASEFSLVAARRSRIAILAQDGNRRAQVLLELIDNLSIYISATQLGITMASLGLGWIGEPAFADLLKKPLVGLVSDTVRHTIALTIAFAVITFLHIVVGELAPKTMALEQTERIALSIAWPMLVFYKMFRWPIRLLDWAGTGTVRLFGLHPSSEHAAVYTSDELRHLIDISVQSGSIDTDEQRLLHGVFEFSDAEVREVMVPRNAVEALPVESTLEETKRTFRTSGYSRIPVYRDQLDDVVGILYRRDLEPYLEQTHTDDFDLERLAHPAKFVPSTIPISTALRQMQASRNHLAVVVDEYGSTEGIVTLEDLLEEIVGEIFDESDPAAPAQIVQDKGSYLLDGSLTVRDINTRLKLHLPEKDSYTTVAGFMLDKAGHLMTAGESIEHEEGRFTVKTLDGLRIRRVRFTPVPTATRD